jgi:hypothetical protein
MTQCRHRAAPEGGDFLNLSKIDALTTAGV